METILRLDRIQGNIVPGFGASYQAFLWLAFPSTSSGRGWLAEMAAEVASAARVMTVKQRRQWSGYAADAPGGPPTTWVNVAFSRAGLERLGARGVGKFSAAFREGMAARATVLGDPDPKGWLVGGLDSPEAHALLIIAAGSSEQLDTEVARQRTRLAQHGVRDLLAEHAEPEPCRGEVLPGRLRMHEHFGFRDGLSQPTADGSDGTMPGDFILGYPDGAGGTTAHGPDWARDGSYLVFRRLRQNVFGFREALRTAARAAGITPDQFGAKLVGRWKSGAKLGERLDPWDPGPPANERDAQYADEFALDPDGERIPRFGHVRKAYPKDVKGAERHRLLRRGIPYGPLLKEGAASDDGEDRGLLFVAYQAKIEAQFEHIQQRLNDPDFPGQGTGRDALAGQGRDPHTLVLPVPGGRTSAPLPLHSYISMTGGGYFFSPSIPALAYLANPTDRWGERKAVMATLPDDRSRLGSFIFDENPYPWPLYLSPDFDQPGSPHVYKAGLGKHFDQKTPFRVVELDRDDPRYMQGLFWSLGGDRTYRVSKAMRIEYDYALPDGTTKTYAIMVAYEGGGGGP